MVGYWYNLCAMSDIFSRWKAGLARTSKATMGRLAGIFGATGITSETWDDLETLLIQADLGIETTSSILDSLREKVRLGGMTKSEEIIPLLSGELLSRLSAPPSLDMENHPFVIMMVGVNGSGKTTTIAKLGHRFSEEGKKVLVIAADTFRAAAVDQMQIWAERENLQIISGQMGSDPGAVVFDGIQSAQSKNVDVVLIDTAGRLHTRTNLMEELKKVNHVAGKVLPGAPHAVWLVLDATTGQNAIIQARSFKDVVGVSGIIIAKLDTSARGGMVFAIKQELDLPVLFAGLGEKAEDLVPFDPEEFVRGILAK